MTLWIIRDDAGKLTYPVEEGGLAPEGALVLTEDEAELLRANAGHLYWPLAADWPLVIPVTFPPPPPPTTIDPLGFMARLTSDEQVGITAASLKSAPIMLFLIKLSGAQTVNVTDALTQEGVAAMVKAGLLTDARGKQILDLTQASP